MKQCMICHTDKQVSCSWGMGHKICGKCWSLTMLQKKHAKHITESWKNDKIPDQKQFFKYYEIDDKILKQ